jgi:hypothetical protein
VLVIGRNDTLPFIHSTKMYWSLLTARDCIRLTEISHATFTVNDFAIYQTRDSAHSILLMIPPKFCGGAGQKVIGWSSNPGQGYGVGRIPKGGK